MDWLRLFATTFLFMLFVLFLFFMVVLPIRPDVPAFVDVPSARSAVMSPEYEHDLTISVRSDGTTYLGNVEVGAVVLERRLAAARVEREEPPAVRVRVDRAAEFQHVRRVVRAARNAGFSRVTFMVRED